MIYTRQGDGGISSLGSEKLGKSDIRFELLGNIDELSSFIGLAKSKLPSTGEEDNKRLTEGVQTNLSLIAASIYDSANNKYALAPNAVSELEARIDYLQGISPVKGFVLAGGCELSACLDICRTVARRTERSFCSANSGMQSPFVPIRPEVLAYLNRLSDFLFALARYADYLSSIEDTVKETVTAMRENTCLSEYAFATGISLQKCRLVSEKIEERAAQMNLSAAVAFCDASGNPILAWTGQDALIVSFDYAIRKAYTAVALKMSTERAQSLTQADQMFFGLSDERLLMIPGGLPIEAGGVIIGGIGVSGGTGRQDKELSEYGASLFAR